MSQASLYEAASPDVVAEDFGSEIVVLNLANGKYFSLLGTAAALWRDITQGHAPGGLIDKLAAAPEAVREGVNVFVQELLREGLIRPAGQAMARPPDAPASSPALLAQGGELPKLEMYDDMAELILSDPIHDVEEDRGWPTIRDPE